MLFLLSPNQHQNIFFYKMLHMGAFIMITVDTKSSSYIQKKQKQLPY